MDHELKQETPSEVQSVRDWYLEMRAENKRRFGGATMMAEEGGDGGEGGDPNPAPTPKANEGSGEFSVPDDFWERPEVVERINGIVSGRVNKVKDEKIAEEAAKRSEAAEKKAKELEARLNASEKKAQLLELVTQHSFTKEDQDLLEETGLAGEALTKYAEKYAKQVEASRKNSTNSATARVNQAARKTPDGKAGQSTQALFNQKVAAQKENR